MDDKVMGMHAKMVTTDQRRSVELDSEEELPAVEVGIHLQIEPSRSFISG
jgi:hypothetical protein